LCRWCRPLDRRLQSGPGGQSSCSRNNSTSTHQSCTHSAHSQSNCCGATGYTAPFLSTYRGRNTRRITLTFHFVSTHDRTVTKAVKRMQQTNRQSSEPTENRVSVDTASHLYAAHAIRMSQKTARSKVRSEAQTRLFSNLPTCPQKIPLPSGSTIEPFGCNNIFRKADTRHKKTRSQIEPGRVPGGKQDNPSREAFNANHCIRQQTVFFCFLVVHQGSYSLSLCSRVLIHCHCHCQYHFPCH
jgi:hypothetical protein